jgi:hypothetical protein
MPYTDLIAPSSVALALIDFQPAMFQGVQSHDRKVIFDNVQVLARSNCLRSSAPSRGIRSPAPLCRKSPKGCFPATRRSTARRSIPG